MLARRFTIVCLLLTLFGIGLASLVTEAAASLEAGGPGVSCPAFSTEA